MHIEGMTFEYGMKELGDFDCGCPRHERRGVDTNLAGNGCAEEADAQECAMSTMIIGAGS